MRVRGLLPAARAAVVALALAALPPATAAAQETGQRFPQSKITQAQWETYFREAKARPGAEIVERADMPDVTMVAVPGEHTIYYFTKPGPAHPAVIVAQVVSRDGAVSLRHSGYYAGDEEAFKRWFMAFTRQADSLRRSLQGQGGE